MSVAFASGIPATQAREHSRASPRPARPQLRWRACGGVTCVQQWNESLSSRVEARAPGHRVSWQGKLARPRRASGRESQVQADARGAEASSQQLRGLSPRANYTDRRSSAKLVPTRGDRGCHGFGDVSFLHCAAGPLSHATLGPDNFPSQQTKTSSRHAGCISTILLQFPSSNTGDTCTLSRPGLANLAHLEGQI
jgi:hypothetical protein